MKQGNRSLRGQMTFIILLCWLLPMVMAASVVLIVVPVLIVYILLQKHIIKGLTAGAIKG